MRLFKVMTVAGLLACTGPATAALLDFRAAAEPAGLGESAYQPLELKDHAVFGGFDITVQGFLGDVETHAYLDANNAGLGVCSSGVSSTGPNPGSGANVCGDASDDNVTVREFVKLTFNEAVTVSAIWLNNNHDDDASLTGDTVTINGTDVLFAAGDIDPARSSGSDGNGDTDFLYSNLFSFAAGDMMTIAYNDEEFYLSAMEVQRVPLPTTIALLVMGLLGIGVARRRIRS